MSNTGFLWFPFLYLQFWRTFIRGLLTAIMSGEWNSGGNGPHVSSTQSGKWFEEQSAKSRYQQKIFWRYLWEKIFASLLVSSTQSGKWFEEQSAKSRYQQNIILKILLENVFCKQVFMSPEQTPESDFRKKISKSKY